MKFGRLKVSLQFFPVALSVIFLLLYAKCNFASVWSIQLPFPNKKLFYGSEVSSLKVLR